MICIFYFMLWESRSQFVLYTRLGGFGGICVCVCACGMGRLHGEDQTKTNPAPDYSLDTDFINMVWQHQVVMCNVDNVYMLFSTM